MKRNLIAKEMRKTETLSLQGTSTFDNGNSKLPSSSDYCFKLPREEMIHTLSL